MKRLLTICAVMGTILILGSGAEALTLTRTATSHLNADVNSAQATRNSPSDADDDTSASSGALNVRAEADPWKPGDPFSPEDGYLLLGYSSFATSEVDAPAQSGNTDAFLLQVNNQGTDDPADDPWGWGWSRSYAFVTFSTSADAPWEVGAPMTVVLDLDFNDPRDIPDGWGQLFAMEANDEFFLDVGYALGSGMTELDPTFSDDFWGNPDPSGGEVNPFLAQFGDNYYSWNEHGLGDDGYDTFTSLTPAFTDTLIYNGFVGDDIQILLNMNSFSWESFGYTWTDGTLTATVTATAIPEPSTASLLALGLVGIAAVGRKRAAARSR
jgi:hypothetical protein